MNEHEDMYEEEEYASEDEGGIVITSAESEIAGFFSFAADMRNDESFCDASLLVQGQLFRAHKIVVRLVLFL